MNSPSHLTRRRFFTYASGFLLAGCTRQQGLTQVVRRSRALGAEVKMTALHEDEVVAQNALDAAFAELVKIEKVMSLYQPQSQICCLNRDGRLAHADPRLIDVLRYAAQVSAKSGGAFDITVQPLWKVHEGKTQADRALLDLARSSVNWQRVKINGSKVLLEGAGTAVTLNGIAQGYAADAAMKVVRAHGVKHVLIDAGEMNARGHNAEGEPWCVGIQHPRERDAFAALARLEDRCLATSGDYETGFSKDFSRHHILDPRTGESPGELASVSVLAPDAMTADALSTALFVLGTERGMELLCEFAGTDALLITKDGRRISTQGFPFSA
ncbi:MAG: FAD:protein FMN transferase [Verrucomicrobiaceae bacterium]|nr:FAD:protein FMN transferase [Verrucomicrobiaceae bacterium]